MLLVTVIFLELSEILSQNLKCGSYDATKFILLLLGVQFLLHVHNRNKAYLRWFYVQPVTKVSKKAKLSPAKRPFASIFCKANQREISKSSSPGRKKALMPAKATPKRGSVTWISFTGNFNFTRT